MKAILILDETPKSCKECRLFVKDEDGDPFCAGARFYFSLGELTKLDKRESYNCPLKILRGVCE